MGNPLNDKDKKTESVQEICITDSNEETETEDINTIPEKQQLPQKNRQLTSRERSALNVAVQQKMSKAKYEAKIISEVASFSNKAYKQGKGKKEIYDWIIKKYKGNKGLEIYNAIKSVLK